MKKQYYRQPALEVVEPADRTFAFTVRFTNFLRKLNIIKKGQQPNQFRTSLYALSMCSKLNLRD